MKGMKRLVSYDWKDIYKNISLFFYMANTGIYLILNTHTLLLVMFGDENYIFWFYIIDVIDVVDKGFFLPIL